MKKIFTFIATLTMCAGLWATDVTGTNVYRNVYTDYATGKPYYCIQINDAGWNEYYFGFKDVQGPMVGQTYTLDDMIADQTYVSVNYRPDAVQALSFTRSYDGLKEQINATVTTQDGTLYNISWATADIPAEMGNDVVLDTIIKCDLRDYGSYKIFTPLVTDYNYYNFTIAFTGDMPKVDETKLYKWKNNTVYIGNANFSTPKDFNAKPFDAQYTITGIDGGWKGTAKYSMTDGHKYEFGFIYNVPVAKETVNLSGYDLKINKWGTIVFSWQGEGYNLNLAINSADTIGNWKGDKIILNNCSFQQSATYTDLGVYTIDAINVTRTEEGYIRLQASILCKNNTLYVLDITNQESPCYVKYDVDGTGVKWQNIPVAQYGNGREMGIRYNSDDIWFNAEPTDEGADHYSIKEKYSTYGDPLWEKDSISISYDPNSDWSKLSVYMAEKYYDAILDVELVDRSYEDVDGKGVWNYNFASGSSAAGNRYSFDFGIYGPITAPKRYTTYTLEEDMTKDHRTKGSDPGNNEIQYDVVTLARELDWYANEAEKITVNVHTTAGNAYKLTYAAAAIPTATDTIHITTKAYLRQLKYWFQFEGESVDPNYRVQIALGKEEVTPTTYYWKQNEIYKPGTTIYNNATGNYVDIADAWVQVKALKNDEETIGYDCDACLLGYDGHCYHAHITSMLSDPTPEVGVQFMDEVSGLKLEITGAITVKVIANGYKEASYTIPATVSYNDATYCVTEIGEGAFDYCESLQSVSMPNVTKVGDKAFAECENLETVNMPKVTEIGHTAFGYCSSLESVIMPKSGVTIGDNAFRYCTSLKLDK